MKDAILKSRYQLKIVAGFIYMQARMEARNKFEPLMVV